MNNKNGIRKLKILNKLDKQLGAEATELIKELIELERKEKK